LLILSESGLLIFYCIEWSNSSLLELGIVSISF